MRTAGWWATWHRCRDIDDWRAWAGRDKTQRTFLFTGRILDDGSDVDKTEWSLPRTEFEDALLDIMDFREAWPRLAPERQRVLALTAAGFSDIEIAAMLGKTQNAVAVQKSQARRILRQLCAVVI